MALVIESLETSKRALHSVLSMSVSRRQVACDDRLLEGEIDPIDLGLSRAASARGVRRALEAADRLHRVHFPAPGRRATATA